MTAQTKKRPGDEPRPLGDAFPNKQQHAAKGPSAPGNDKPANARAQALKSCVTCGNSFAPNRTRFRKCPACARMFKQAQIDLIKQRQADGVTVFRLLEHLHKLRSDDPAARAWLESLIANGGDDVER